jgi:predicted enzyme related to lactoylglutathione lyase
MRVRSVARQDDPEHADAVPASLAHFAINADDVDAARRFYEAVFDFGFSAWGPPGFYLVDTGATDRPAIAGALQQRRELIPGTRTVTFECTFAVDDVDVVAAAVLANGGRILMEKTTIAGVGDLIWIADPDGNALGAMRYDPSAT